MSRTEKGSHKKWKKFPLVTEESFQKVSAGTFFSLVYISLYQTEAFKMITLSILSKESPKAPKDAYMLEF